MERRIDFKTKTFKVLKSVTVVTDAGEYNLVADGNPVEIKYAFQPQIDSLISDGFIMEWLPVDADIPVIGDVTSKAEDLKETGDVVEVYTGEPEVAVPLTQQDEQGLPVEELPIEFCKNCGSVMLQEGDKNVCPYCTPQVQETEKKTE